MPLLGASFCLVLAALLLVFAGRGSRQLRERVLGQSGRAVATLAPTERSLIARPRGEAGGLARLSAWVGLAPGQLPTRRIPVPVILLLSGVIGGLVAWKGAYMIEGPWSVLFGVGGVAFALRAAFKWEVGRNRDEAFKQIPDAVGLMVRAVRAGLPIGEAMRSVAREMPDPTRAEFQRLLAETGIGVTLEKALWGVHERTGLKEYAFLSVVIGLQQQTGGSLAEALDNLGDIVRKRVQMVGKARALSSQARTSAAILVALPPFSGAAVSLIRPGYMDALFGDPRGMNLLLTAIIMLGGGIMVIRWIIKKSTTD